MGLKGYTFDRMKISPKADALLYHSMLDGNDRIVKGYKDELKVVATGLNTYVSPGACVVQGRLIEIDEEMQLSVSANDSGYVCVVIDLTQNNTSTGEAGTPDYQPVNNQIRLEAVKELVQQNLHDGGQLYTFPLASFNSTGTTVALTKINHNQRIVENGSNANGSWTKFADGTMICRHLMIAKGTSVPRGPLFASPSTRWTYPIAFTGNPMVTAFARSGASGVWYANGDEGAGVQYASWRMLNVNNVSSDINVELMAIGPWK
ncbi:hypothetical protein [Enterococcus sp.]|uniref:hypothetical protein n=1 Tax=Enterococcus sp. TaxID=35783 RepID=UPI002FCC35E1